MKSKKSTYIVGTEIGGRRRCHFALLSSNGRIRIIRVEGRLGGFGFGGHLWFRFGLHSKFVVGIAHNEFVFFTGGMI